MGTRKLTEIKLLDDHPLANLLALTKYLGLTLAEAKRICKGPIGTTISMNPALVIKSKLTSDEIFDVLNEYHIIVGINVVPSHGTKITI